LEAHLEKCQKFVAAACSRCPEIPLRMAEKPAQHPLSPKFIAPVQSRSDGELYGQRQIPAHSLKHRLDAFDIGCHYLSELYKFIQIALSRSIIGEQLRKPFNLFFNLLLFVF